LNEHMEKLYSSKQSSLLLLQPQPVVANKIQQAVSSFNCRVNPVNDERELFRYYQSSFTNPFGIFAEKSVRCLIFNLIDAGKKTTRILGELRDNFEIMPPVIGLYSQAKLNGSGRYYQKGFDEMIVFPASTEELRNILKKYIDQPLFLSEKPENPAVKQALDQLPVVNLKTYSVFAELAKRQQFPMHSLFSSFIDEMEAFVISLIRSYEKGDIRQCERLCVSIKSLGRTLGASQVAEAAKYMEMRVKGQQWQEAGQWLPVIIEKYLVLREHLQETPEKKATSLTFA